MSMFIDHLVKHGYDRTKLTDTWNSLNSKYMTSKKSLESFIEEFIDKMYYEYEYNRKMMKLTWAQVTCSNFDPNLTPKQDLCQNYKQLLIQNAIKLLILSWNPSPETRLLSMPVAFILSQFQDFLLKNVELQVKEFNSPGWVWVQSY